MATIVKNGQVTPEEIDLAAEAVRMFLVGQASATKDEIRAFCREKGIDTTLYQKAFARLDRQLNIVTETSKDGQKAWELKELARKTSLREIVEFAAGAKPESKREKYEAWYPVVGSLTLTSPCLSSCPTEDPSKRNFERASDGSVLLLSGYYRAMFLSVRSLPSDVSSSALYHIVWAQQRVSAKHLITVQRPVPPARPGGSGQGITHVEALKVGTEIPFEALVPGSHIDRAHFDQLMALCGRFVGFSPSSATRGYGRFEYQPSIAKQDERMEMKTSAQKKRR